MRLMILILWSSYVPHYASCQSVCPSVWLSVRLSRTGSELENKKVEQAVVRGTTNPAPSIAASRGLPELTHNLIRSSHGHSTPSMKISCKSVQPFSRNLADKETNKETKKQTKKSSENNTPSPYRGGVKSKIDINVTHGTTKRS